MSEALENAAAMLPDAFTLGPEERRNNASRIIIAFLDTEGMAEKLARAMRQLEVNEGEDGWSGLPQHDKHDLMNQARAALSALRAEAGGKADE